jgi:hypothetical protein
VHFEVVAIGGGALSLLGLIERSTEDIDLVGVVHGTLIESAEPLPEALSSAIADIAKLHSLRPKWMNNEPTSLLVHGLPVGFLARCVSHEWGGLKIFFASRFDQLHLKLLAISSPGDKHHVDLKRLQPTKDELIAAARWARTQAAGEGFEMELRASLRSFGVDVDDV